MLQAPLWPPDLTLGFEIFDRVGNTLNLLNNHYVAGVWDDPEPEEGMGGLLHG